ncbi:hypothetical protein M8J76_016308 [Diaphorina citri]|nr:hypothetical protein M8J76_016308 [Diaphorina citri]
MRAKSVHIEVLALLILSQIPWPGPTIFKISCPRDSATIVRRVIQKKWLPILDRYHVKLPLECPFHPSRDIFYPQQEAKHQHRPSQWTCGLCGKSFYEEKYLDWHFDNRHRSHVNLAEDAVCLADYCDIMRCEVVRHQNLDISPDGTSSLSTDLEIWREANTYHTALAPVGPRELIRVPYPTIPSSSRPGSTKQENSRCLRSEAPSNSNQDGEGNATCDNLVDSSVPPKQRTNDVQKLKANCRPDQLFKLKQRCEALVRDCILGLLINLSVDDFKEVEDELNQAVCWYLTCDRYWEEPLSDLKGFPWGLVFVFVMVLSLGLCLCYYIIWVLSDDLSIGSNSVTDSPSPHHSQYNPDLGPDEQYIYVTYPPELKRRLLESCYNRTSRI